MEDKHLVEGSRERGYWAYGYLTALVDVLSLLRRERFGGKFDGGDRDRRRFAA